MLILTRRPGEAIMIGHNAEVEVRVLGVKGNQVRIGVEAEDGAPIDREEIYTRKQTECSASNDTHTTKTSV